MQDAGMPLPAIAGQLASLYATREPLRQSLDILDKEIRRVETLAHQTMARDGIHNFSTHDGVLTIKPKPTYIPSDWSAVYAHIQSTGEFDLLHKRLSITALNERAAHEMPPGVTKTQFDEFKFTPTKGK